MKILLVNGSPHKSGCTYTALREMQNVFEAEGMAADHFWIGAMPIAGCIDCGGCGKKGECVFQDSVNDFLKLAGTYDAFLFGSPVHYAAATGALSAFMGRAFYADLHSGQNRFYLKPAAAIVSARRAGTTAALDQLNKFFLWGHMPIISSRYWNMVHGQTPEQVLSDTEGIRNLRMLAQNMVWFLRCKEAGAKDGVPLPHYD